MANSSRIKILVGVVLLVTAISLPVYAASSVAGEWKGTSKDTPQGDMTFTLSLKQDGDTVTGELDLGQGTFEIIDGTFKSNKLSFTIKTPDGNSFEVTGTLDKDQLTGTWKDNNGTSGTWTAEKGK
jgi:hypothetical protein